MLVLLGTASAFEAQFDFASYSTPADTSPGAATASASTLHILDSNVSSMPWNLHSSQYASAATDLWLSAQDPSSSISDISLHSVKLSFFQTSLRLDSNITMHGNLETGSSGGSISAFAPYSASWVVSAYVNFSTVDPEVVSSRGDQLQNASSAHFFIRDAHKSLQYIHLSQSANIIAILRMQWTDAQPEATVTCQQLHAWRGRRWEALDGPRLCSGFIQGHPVVPYSTPDGVNITVPEGGMSPQWWSSLRQHNVTAVVHMPLQDVLLSFAQSAALQDAQGATSAQIHVHGVLHGSVSSAGLRGGRLNASLSAVQAPLAMAPLSLGLPWSTAVYPRSMAIAAVSAGDEHTCAIYIGGRVKCVGNGDKKLILNLGVGKLGYGSTYSWGQAESLADTPFVQLPGPAVHIKANMFHTCAALLSGDLYCWGDNSLQVLGYGVTVGVIGDDETPASVGPVPVSGHTVASCGGQSHTCALNDAGVVACWGLNQDGTLGIGSSAPVFSASLAQPVPLLDAAVDIQSGLRFTCALLQSGEVQCWGFGASQTSLSGGAGQLGYGNTNTIGAVNTPADVGAVPLGEPVVLMAVGQWHVCTLLLGGAVRCWGANQDPEVTPSIPEIVPGRGRLGLQLDESIGDDEPVTDAPLLDVPLAAGEAVVGISAGYAFNCLLTSTSRVWCWGGDNYGNMGHPFRVRDDEFGFRGAYSTARQAFARGPVSLNGRAVAITCGQVHTMVLLEGGMLQHFGTITFGRAGVQYAVTAHPGRGDVPSSFGIVDAGYTAPLRLATQLPLQQPQFHRYVQVAAADGFIERACAVDQWGALLCWGDNTGEYELGVAALLAGSYVGDDEWALRRSGLQVKKRVTQVAMGWYHTCFIDVDDGLSCFGGGFSGKLGYGGWSDKHAGEAVLLSSLGAVRQVALGQQHTCAVSISAQLYCWGSSLHGAIGRSSSASSPPSTPVALLGAVAHVSAGSYYTCATLVTGEIQCFGLGANGRTGYNDELSSNSFPNSLSELNARGAVPVSGSEPAIMTATGTDHTCALFVDGSVQCWGSAFNDEFGLIGGGKLGYGHGREVGSGTLSSSSLQEQGKNDIGEAVVGLELSDRHSCAILASGGLKCWGGGMSGSLLQPHLDNIGDDETPASVPPARMAAAVIDIATGKTFTCVVLQTGAMDCVGNAGDGALGMGTTQSTASKGIPWYTTLTQRYAVDLSSHLALGGISPALTVLGSKAAWRSITEVRSCAACSMSALHSLPQWLLGAMRGAHAVDMRLPAAATGIRCAFNLQPTVWAVDICDVSEGCTRDGVADDSTVLFAQTCAWPAEWTSGSPLRIAAVSSASNASAPAVVPAVGAVQVRVQGSFWALSLVSDLTSAFRVLVGNMECTGSRLLSTTVLVCSAPALPVQDVSGGVPVTLEHGFDGLPNPVMPDAATAAKCVVHYLPPFISALSPATGMGIGGGMLQVRGEHLWGGASSVAQPQVWLHSSSSAQSPAAQCAVTQTAASSVQCSVPAGQGSLWVRLCVGGQCSGLERLQYIVPQLTAVQPSILLWGPSDTSVPVYVNVTISGSSLAAASSSVRATVAGAACGSVTRVSAETLLCIGLDSRHLDASAPTGDVQLVVVTAAGEELAAVLRSSVRVYGEVSVSGVRGVPLPNGGGLLSISGLELGRTGPGSMDIAAVSLAGGSVHCVVQAVTAQGVACTAPAGVGTLSPLIITRVGGANTSLVDASLAYERPVVATVAPASLLVGVAGTVWDANVTITGSGFGSRSTVAPETISVTVGGHPCNDVVHASSSSLLCMLSDTSLLAEAPSPALVLVTVGGQAPISSPSIALVKQPTITAVQPAVVSAAGGAVITVLGSALGAGLQQHVAGVMVGAAACTVLSVSPSGNSLTCTAPSLIAAAAVSAAVTVQLVSGGAGQLPGALLYTQPELLRVQGGSMSVAAAPGLVFATVTAQGLALGSIAVPGNGSITIGDVSCGDAGGWVQLAPSGRTLSCVGLDTGRLPAVPAGDVRIVPLQVTTNDGVQVSLSDAATVALYGPPTISRLAPAQAAVGATVSIIGANMGLSSDDVVGVSFGAVPVPLADWQRSSSGSITVLSVPSADSRDVDALADAVVTVHLRSGHTASTSMGSGFSYDVAPEAPLTAAAMPCAYRDDSGTARVAWLWEDDDVTRLTPVTAWVVELSTVPWFRGAGDGAIITRVLAADSSAPGEVIVGSTPVAACAGVVLPPADAAQGSFRVVDVRVLDAPVAPVWVRVRAATDASQQSLWGPASAVRGPLFSSCDISQYLATQYAARSKWSAAICRPCPVGGVCEGRPWEGMGTKPGYYRVGWMQDALYFEACLKPEFCPGVGNVTVSHEALGYLEVQWSHPAYAATHALQVYNYTAMEATSAGAGRRLQNAGEVYVPHPLLPTAFKTESLRVHIPVEVLLPNSSVAVSSPAGSTAVVSTIAGDSSCTLGHTGPLCAKCSHGYGRLGSSQCVQCVGGTSRAVGLLFVFFLVISAAIAWLLRGQIITRGVNKKAHSVVKKLLLTHVQQTSLLLAFDLEWPSPFSVVLEASDTASAASSSFVSLDCVGSDGSTASGMSAFRMQVLATLIGPVVIFLLAEAIFALLWKVGKLTQSEAYRRMLIACVVIGYLFYTPLTRSIMQLFTCVTIGGQSRLVQDYSVLCDSAANNGWRYGFGLPLLMLVVVGIPSGLFWLLHRSQDQLYTSDWHRRTLGFLFLGYKPEFYWYEIVIMARKAVFAMILVALYPQGLLWQIAMAMMVMMISITVSASFKPFSEPLFNHLDVASLMLSMATVAGGAMLLQAQLVDQAASDATSDSAVANVPTWPHYEQAGQAVTVLLTGLNVVFVAVLVVWMFRSLYKSEVAPRIHRVTLARKPSGHKLHSKLAKERRAKTASWRQGSSTATSSSMAANPLRGEGADKGGAGAAPVSGLLVQAALRGKLRGGGADQKRGASRVAHGLEGASGVNPLVSARSPTAPSSGGQGLGGQFGFNAADKLAPLPAGGGSVLRPASSESVSNSDSSPPDDRAQRLRQMQMRGSFRNVRMSIAR